MSAETIRLSDDQLATLADLIAERLDSRPPVVELVDATELSEILHVSRDAVYDAADELGAIRVGKPGSRRPRIMFNVQTAVARRGAQIRQHSAAPARHDVRTRRAEANSVPLLPIKYAS
jgi:hypothetical protein